MCARGEGGTHQEAAPSQVSLLVTMPKRVPPQESSEAASASTESSASTEDCVLNVSPDRTELDHTGPHRPADQDEHPGTHSTGDLKALNSDVIRAEREADQVPTAEEVGEPANEACDGGARRQARMS